MMLRTSTEKCIYFGANFIELKTIDKNNIPLSFISSKITLANLNNLNCPSLCGNSLNCQINLFDIKKFLGCFNQKKISSKHSSNDISSTSSKITQNNYLFYTQTDNGYFNNNVTTTANNNIISSSANSQVDSILDALENIGYYGFVTFRVNIHFFKS